MYDSSPWQAGPSSSQSWRVAELMALNVGWLRYLYRPLVSGTVARFAKALAEHEITQRTAARDLRNVKLG